jgi:hypothetical protein
VINILQILFHPLFERRIVALADLPEAGQAGFHRQSAALAQIVFIDFRAQRNWRRLNAPHLVIKVIEGVGFKDGLDVKPKKPTAGMNAA